MASKTLEIRIKGKNDTQSAFQGVSSGAKEAFDGVKSGAAGMVSSVAGSYNKIEAAGNRLNLTLLKLAEAQEKLAAETDPAKQAELKVQIDDLTQSAHKYAAAIDGVGDETQDTATKMGGMGNVVGTIRAALGAFAVKEVARAVVELGELGAAAQRTETAFTAISGGAAAASANLNAMMAATNGALSRTEAMAHASRLLQMGLAKNSDELGQMTEMAVRLGTAMGRDANTAIEEFSLLLANQSILRLDTFGISAGKVRERIAELQAETAGLSREQAFLIAVQEEGAVAMDRLGDATEDAAMQIEQSKAALQDLRVEIGKRLASAVGGANSVIGKFTRQWGDNLRVMNENDGEIGWLRANIDMLRDTLGATNTVFDDYRSRQRDTAASTARLSAQAEHYAKQQAGAVHTAADAWDQYARATTGAAQASDRAAYQLRQVEVAAQREARATLLVNAVHSNLGDTLRDQESDLQDLYGQREDMLRQLEDLRGEHGRYITVQKEAAMTEAELAYSTALLADKRAKLAEADPGSLNAAKLAKDIEALEGKLADTGGAFTSMVDHGKEISELEGNIAGVTAKIDDLTAANREAVASFMFEQVVSRFDLGALTEAQSIVLEGLAEAAGIDTTFIKLTSGLLDYEQGWDGVGESVDEANENARHFLGIADQMAMDPDLSWAEAADRYFSNLRQSAGGTVQPLLDTEAAAQGIGGALGEAGDAALDLPERMTEARDGSQQPMMDMEGYAIGLGTALETAGTTGVRSLSEISATTGNALELMRELGLSAEAAQVMLDRMHGKTIEMEVNWVERGRPQAPDGSFIEGRPDVGWNAAGGDYIINQPTLFGAGEAGPERAIFIPQGEPGYNAPTAELAALAYAGGLGGGLGGGVSSTTWNGDLVIQGAGNPEATAAAVERRLQDRGLLPRVTFR